MTILPEQLSHALQQKVVVNGKVDLEKLQEIANSQNQKLAEEAGKILRAELSGSGSATVIGDSYEPTTQNGVGKYISDWWSDRDKVSTDGEDDGNISAGEKTESLAKGFTGGIVKSIAKNPVESAVAIGGTAVAAYGATTALTALGVVSAGPIVAAGLVLVGLGFGAKAIYDGLKGAKEADNDGTAKAGYEEAGTGAAVVALSALGGRKIGKSKPTETAKPVESAKPAPAEMPAAKAVEPALETTPAKTPPVETTIPVESQPANTAKPTAAKPTKTRAVTLSELQRQATLDKAGFTKDVIAKLKNEKFSYGQDQMGNTLRIAEYLERRIADGEKITPDLVRKAINECDGPYAQSGYGSTYQAEQLEVLNKYWSKAEEARVAYKKEGRFFTESERIATEAAQRKATLDKAGFTEDVLAELENTQFSYGKGQLANTLKIVEYLEGRIAKGEKLSYTMVHEAIKACDDIYAQPGYGYTYQQEQLGILARYWTHGKELMDICK